MDILIIIISVAVAVGLIINGYFDLELRGWDLVLGPIFWGLVCYGFLYGTLQLEKQERGDTLSVSEALIQVHSELKIIPSKDTDWLRVASQSEVLSGPSDLSQLSISQIENGAKHITLVDGEFQIQQ